MSAGGNTYTDSFTSAGGTTTLTGDTISMYCNDSSGFDVYAIGYSGGSYYTNNTDLIFSGNNADYNIKTDGTNGASYWKMKIETSGASNVVTIDNNYDDYSVIPSSYTKIAHYTSNITSGTSSIIPTYQVYVSSVQPHGSYTGKVEYRMVHPNNTVAPIAPKDPPTTCNTKVPNINYMQDITAENKATVLASLTEDAPYYLWDKRDGEPYCVSKLKDGNLWMLDNLRLGDTSPITLTPDDTNIDITSWTLPASSDSSGFSQNAVGYPTARINIDSKNMTVAGYGSGSKKVGVYYNYCAASAGNICANKDSNSDDGSPDRDVCPKGWRIPTGSNSGEYKALGVAITGTDASYYGQTSYRVALSTVLSGFYSAGWGGPHFQGTDGYLWSSTRYDNNIMYELYIASKAYVNSYSYGYRYKGNSVRCLLK